MSVHALIVAGQPEEWETEVLHPESCPVAIATIPYFDWYTSGIHYLCQVADEIRHVGFDSMFPDGLTEGYYLLDPWAHKTPSTPSGPAEYDAGVDVTPLEMK